jgi:predicted phage-related endonuclease
MNAVIHDVQQGTEAWNALRAQHDTASEAPAALGQSKYTPRSELLKQKKTGISKAVDGFQQTLFDRGHAAEASARAIAEEIIGSDLFPVTATLEIEGLRLLASLDGQTMDDEDIWEHKLWNEALAADVRAGTLAPHYTIQMDQQLLVTGARRCLFMTSDGTRENMAHCWYETTPEKQAALIAGWKQFNADLAAYVPEAPADPKPMPHVREALPALIVEAKGEVTKSTIDKFEPVFLERMASIQVRPADGESWADQQWANAKEDAKFCRGLEKAANQASAAILGRMESVDEVIKKLEFFAETARRKAIDLENSVEAEEKSRKAQIRTDAQTKFTEHVAALNKRLGKDYMPAIPANFDGATKNKRTIESLQNAVDTELARLKIEANAIADRIQANLKAVPEEHALLFPDLQAICTKAPDDFAALVSLRVANFKAAEDKRKADEDAAAAKRKTDEEERAAVAVAVAPQVESLPGMTLAVEAGEAPPVLAVAPAANVVPITQAPTASGSRPMISLGEIKTLFSPVELGADGWRALGFEHVAKERATLLYYVHELPRMRAALVKHLNAIQFAEAA